MAEFDLAFNNTLHYEDHNLSGRVTVDAGGRTRFGIAEKFHPNLPEEFFSGPGEDALAEAERIEREEYWERMNLSSVADQKIANKLFDMGVNMGVRQAAVFAQRAANALLQDVAPGPRLAEDGVIGPATLHAVNTLDAAAYH